MPRNERAQWARLDIDGVALLADLAAGASLARPMQFDGTVARVPDLQCFGAPAARSEPLVVGSFTGRVVQGASCNCSVLHLTPHANGTHTECAGHLTAEPLDAWRVIPQRLLVAAVLSVQPELAAECDESSAPAPRPGDRLITRAALARAWPPAPTERLGARAAVVRTLPNERDRFTSGDTIRAPTPSSPPSGIAPPPAAPPFAPPFAPPSAAAPPPAAPPPAASSSTPPYLSREAASELVARSISHLVLDVPSADRVEDGGLLNAHRIFFGLPPGSSRLEDVQRRDCTITELAWIDDSLPDGWYLLSLQSPAIDGDAVPSRPLLYPLRLA